MPPNRSRAHPSFPFPFRLSSGGPAGLVALKTLTENGFDPILFEAEDEVGGTFRSVDLMDGGEAIPNRTTELTFRPSSFASFLADIAPTRMPSSSPPNNVGSPHPSVSSTPLLTLHSLPTVTSFSDFRFPLDQPDHISLKQYCDYLERYIDHFGLRSRINTGARVISVKRKKADERKGHLVQIRRKGSSGSFSPPLPLSSPLSTSLLTSSLVSTPPRIRDV